MTLATRFYLLLSVVWTFLVHCSNAGQFPATTASSSQLPAQTPTSPSPTTTPTKPLIQTLFFPLFEASSFAASVVSVQSALTTYVVNCVSTSGVQSNTASCGLQNNLTITEGGGTFLATLEGTGQSTITSASTTLTGQSQSTPTSTFSSEPSGTTVYCTVRGPPAANSRYAYSKSIFPTQTPAIDYSSVPLYAATAVCVTNSTIAGLGIAATTTSLSGSDFAKYASATVTVTAGAEKILNAESQGNGSSNDGDSKPSAANGLSVSGGRAGFLMAAAAFVGVLLLVGQ